MKEQNILLIGGVSLVKGRVKDSGTIMKDICEEIEPILEETRFIADAPFKTVSIIFRFGENEDLSPEYSPINYRYSELPVAVEFSLSSLRSIDSEKIKNIFMNVTIKILLDIAHKFNLPSKKLEVITLR